VCNRQWTCTEWSACSGGLERRQCNLSAVPQFKQSPCPSAWEKPALNQSCSAQVTAQQPSVQPPSAQLPSMQPPSAETPPVEYTPPPAQAKAPPKVPPKSEPPAKKSGFPLLLVAGIAAILVITATLVIFLRRGKPGAPATPAAPQGALPRQPPAQPPAAKK
jgi:hypothetical protein